MMIEPIGYCNLHCKMCYTKHCASVLAPDTIEKMVSCYLDTIPGALRLFWIGRGEVTLYKHLVPIINRLSESHPDRISHLIQTNGIKIAETARQFRMLDNVKVCVSLDGFEKANDANRGKGTFQKIVENIKELVAMGLRTNVQCILTPCNVNDAIAFEQFVHDIAPGSHVQFLYPVVKEDFEHANKETIREPALSKSDITCIDDALDSPELSQIRSSIDRSWRTRYVSISCEGYVYNCCEFQIKIGDIHTNVADLIERVKDDGLCRGCYLRKLCFPEQEFPAKQSVHA
ncbi:MAG: radical SAM protein [Candidatus Sigynarchaeum springense]